MKGPLYLNPKQRIGGGGDGAIYLVGQNLAIKLNIPNEQVSEEHSIAQDLYNNGISVPRPRGIFDVKFYGMRLKAWGMDYKEHNWRDYPEEAERQRQLEIEKVKKLGYAPEDYGYRHNCLWVPKEKRVYLIDFVGWKKIGAAQ